MTFVYPALQVCRNNRILFSRNAGLMRRIRRKRPNCFAKPRFAALPSRRQTSKRTRCLSPAAMAHACRCLSLHARASSWMAATRPCCMVTVVRPYPTTTCYCTLVASPPMHVGASPCHAVTGSAKGGVFTLILPKEKCLIGEEEWRATDKPYCNMLDK